MITILADADYIDRATFELTVNFERMLERRIPKLDISRWVDYISLDAGLRPTADDRQVQVVLVYSPQKATLKNCLPAQLDTELNGTAIKTNLAEFCFASCRAEEGLATLGDLYEQALAALLSDPDTEQVILVADIESYGQQVRDALSRSTSKADTILFAPQAVAGYKCRQEILTYSLMAALNIRGEELSQL